MSAEANIAFDENDWAYDPETDLWLATRGGYVYRERPAEEVPTSAWAWPEANEPVGYIGDGSYVDLHPSRWGDTWRSDVEQVARYLVDNYSVSCNTYVRHPPLWNLDAESIDCWGPAGRGDSLDWNLAQSTFNDIFGNGKEPWIRWGVIQGSIWDDYNGWRPFWEYDAWSDGPHNRHWHISFW